MIYQLFRFFLEIWLAFAYSRETRGRGGGEKKSPFAAPTLVSNRQIGSRKERDIVIVLVRIHTCIRDEHSTTVYRPLEIIIWAISVLSSPWISLRFSLFYPSPSTWTLGLTTINRNFACHEKLTRQKEEPSLLYNVCYTTPAISRYPIISQAERLALW